MWDEAVKGEFARLAAHPEVMRFIGDGSPWSSARTDEVFAGLLGEWPEHGFGWRTAYLKGSRAFVGFIGLNHIGPEAIEIPDRDAVEIGWWLDPAFWGRGLATEGALAIRDEAFRRVGLDHIIARHKAANPASGRIMEKIGMTFQRSAKGRHGDAIRVFSMSKNEWAALVDRPED